MERSFNQTLGSVTMLVPLEPGTRAKNLKVELKPHSLHVVNHQKQIEILSGELFAPIVVDESTWWVEDTDALYLTLEKQTQQWWPHVLTTDPKIDITKIEPEKSRLSDLDPQTRGTVEKMMYDQQQKQQGLPTSDEAQKMRTLEKFKQMHPELDFSKAKTQF